MIDGVVATLIEGREAGLQRVWNQRPNVGIVRLDVDRRGEFAGAEQLPDRLSRLDGQNVGGCFVALDMLVAGQDPGDLAQVDPVFFLEYRARPHTRSDRITPVHADPLPFEVLRLERAEASVVNDRPVMKRPHQENRQGGKTNAMLARTQIRRQCHLADIEFESAHHASKRMHEHRNFLEVEMETGRRDGAVLERGIVALGAGHGS